MKTSPACPLSIALAFAASGRTVIAIAQSSPPPSSLPNPPRRRRTSNAACSKPSRQQPDSFEAHRALASFYLQQGQAGRGASASSTGAGDRSLSIRQRLRPRPSSCSRQANCRAAREQVDPHVDPEGHGRAHNLLGDIEERSGNLVAAAEEYQRALRTWTRPRSTCSIGGTTSLQLRAFEPRDRGLHRCDRERHPKSARLHIGLGIAQYSRGQSRGRSRVVLPRLPISRPRIRVPTSSWERCTAWPRSWEAEVTERLGRFVEARPRKRARQSLLRAEPVEGQHRRFHAGGHANVSRRCSDEPSRSTPSSSKGFVGSGPSSRNNNAYRKRDSGAPARDTTDPDQSQPHYRLAQAYFTERGQKVLAANELAIFERLKNDPADTHRSRDVSQWSLAESCSSA